MNGSIRPAAFITAMVLLVATSIALPAALRLLNVHMDKLEVHADQKFHTLPTTIPSDGDAKWKRFGTDQVMEKSAVEELGTENWLTRSYVEVDPVGPEPRTFQLHCAYYTGMIDTVPHVPERCLVGAGIDIAGKSQRVEIPLTLAGRTYADPDIDEDAHGEILLMRNLETNNDIRLPRNVEELAIYVTPFRAPDGAKIFAGYFFLANGEVVAQADEVRLKAFNLDDDYAYYAKIQFSSTSVSSAEELGELVGSVLDDLLPDLMLRVPDWVDVKDGRYPATDAS